MRIGIFTDTYLPDINGVVTSAELLRKKLSEKGHEVFVICTYKGVVNVKKEGNIIMLPGVEIKKLYGYKMTSPLHLFYMDDIEDLKLDIIHAETEFGVGIFANIVSSYLNIPLVRTYHTTYEDYTHYLNLLKLKSIDKGLKKFVAKVSKLYCNNCVRLIAPSNKTADMLRSYGVTTSIDIIPTGIELSSFKKENTSVSQIETIRKRYNVNNDERLLLFLGRIAKEKSIDMIINSFMMVKENNLKLKLLIVGDGPLLKDLKEQVETLGLSSYVFFAGKVPFKDVPAYYHSADGFISASVSETQGMTYIEALASGLPVLARYDQVLDDIVVEGKSGFFFNNDDELKQVIKRFASLDNVGYEEMSLYGTKLVNRYDADTFVNSSIELYEKAIDEYQNSFIINKTSLKDNYVVLSLKTYDGQEEKTIVSLDAYYELGLKKDTKISRYNFELLKANEDYVLAYKSCLRRLASKDYSEKEIRDYIVSRFNLNESKIKLLIEKLKEYKLIDDYHYATSKVNSLKANMLSTKAIKNKLLNAGISEDIIAKCVVDSIEEEEKNAKHKAEKYNNSIKNKSTNLKKKSIYAKLIADGFSYDVAKEAVDNLDYSKSLDNEEELLRKEYLKIRNKYEKKYSGYELKNKIYAALVLKGFNYDNINTVMNETEENDG